MRKIILGLFLFICILSLPHKAFGQGGFYRDISLQWNGVNLIPNAGGQVTICAAGAVGNPCSPTITIYSNAALTATQTNPITTGSDGSWSLYLTPGQYSYTVTGTGLNPQGPFLFNVPPVITIPGGGSGTVALEPKTSDAIQYVSINGNDANDGFSAGTAKLTPQAALNALPGGQGTVYLLNGTYALNNTTNEQIKITKSVNFMCQSWNTILQVGSSVGAIPVIHIVPSGVVRGIRIQDCHIQPQSSTPGSYGIQVDTTPNNNINLFVVEHVWIEQLGTGSIWMNNTAGEVNGGLFDGQIEHSYLNGGILGTLVGDSLSISKNLIQGTGTGIDVNFTPGSSTLRIEDNTINPTTNAAIHIGSAANFTQIQGNEFETPNSSGVGSNGAFVDIDGTMANAAFQVDLNHNSFQMVNGSTLTGLRLNWSNNANVRENSFTARGAAAFAIAITANATGTRLRPNSFGGDTIAHAISDSATNGQTQYELGGQASTYTNIAYANKDGSTYLSGQTSTAQQFGAGNNGANYLYDGATNSIAGAFSPAPSVVTIPGGLTTGFLASKGVFPTVTGTGACATNSTNVGGLWNGRFVCTGTTGASTVTLTFAITATSGWNCTAFDRTTRANLVEQTSDSQTTCVLTATSVTQNDVIQFTASAY